MALRYADAGAAPLFVDKDEKWGNASGTEMCLK